MNCSECNEPMTELDPREITDPQPSRFIPRWRCDEKECPRQGEVVEDDGKGKETAVSWLTYGQAEKHGRCQFCSCDGLLAYIDPLEMWLCFDCQTEYEDADEVMLLSGWIQEAAPGTCRVCGCTAERGCYPARCYWVEPDLCSNCAGPLPSEEAS